MSSFFSMFLGIVDSVLELVREFWRRRKHRRLLILLPVLLLLASVMALIGSAGVLAPFVYPLF
jgi:hypothetical protein